VCARESESERERASKREITSEAEEGGRGLINVQRPIPLCDATLSNLLLLQDFHDGNDEIPFDMIKKGTVCTGSRVRARIRHCGPAPPARAHAPVCQCHPRGRRVRFSLSPCICLSLSPPPPSLLHSFSVAFTLSGRACALSLSLSHALSLLLSVPSFLCL